MQAPRLYLDSAGRVWHSSTMAAALAPNSQMWAFWHTDTRQDEQVHVPRGDPDLVVRAHAFEYPQALPIRIRGGPAELRKPKSDPAPRPKTCAS